MNLTAKEKSLLEDIKTNEQLCIDKYTRYSEKASKQQLKDIFNEIKQAEISHLNTVTEILNGVEPNVGSSSGFNASAVEKEADYSEQDKENDKYLCQDALSTEKYVSGAYDTSIFEFAQAPLRNVLNGIQKAEQQHGEKIYNYMAANGMYN